MPRELAVQGSRPRAEYRRHACAAERGVAPVSGALDAPRASIPGGIVSLAGSGQLRDSHPRLPHRSTSVGVTRISVPTPLL